MTNADLAARLDTSDEWIVERTGMQRAPLAGADEHRQPRWRSPPGAKAIAPSGLAPERRGPRDRGHDDSRDQRCRQRRRSYIRARAPLAAPSTWRGLRRVRLRADHRIGDAWDRRRASWSSAPRPSTRIVDPADRINRPLFGDGAGALVARAGSAGDGALLAWDSGCDARPPTCSSIPPATST